MEIPRRAFIKASGIAALSLAAPLPSFPAADASVLPEGAAPAPVALPHFPDRLHAFVWRNWQLVPIEKMASLLSAGAADILALGQSMGLVEPGPISLDQWSRSYLTIIRRNWHLLPYSQLLQLLDWTPFTPSAANRWRYPSGYGSAFSSRSGSP